MPSRNKFTLHCNSELKFNCVFDANVDINACGMKVSHYSCSHELVVGRLLTVKALRDAFVRKFINNTGLFSATLRATVLLAATPDLAL
jgi:hypothetical protein